MDWAHIKKKRMGKYQKRPYYETLKEAGREEDLRIAGEDRSSRKRVEAGTNWGSWQLIDRSGKNSKKTCVPKGTIDPIIIIILIIIITIIIIIIITGILFKSL